ncbi:amidase [Hyphodiscus hymeniophilus]|uniref:Amidase n=1 Tax=Hyphodiscus hymeniophilus TaxID=353542 RepID=A0A9P6VDI9_9HELO|nr:amidase [Hyphodiscus hymeniophilus]
MDPLTWAAVAGRRQDEINNAIPEPYRLTTTLLEACNLIKLPETCGILEERELKITSHTATELLKLLHNETYTAVEVTKAFCKRAAVAHQATNCLAWIMFEQALEDAAALDAFMQTHHRPQGPLHGLPISVKECINIKHTPSTSGFIAWADNFQDDDALIVKTLRAAGAIFHVKTTDPQGLMVRNESRTSMINRLTFEFLQQALECVSNLYGLTTNPHNKKLTPGGSTGGEGALIAMRGSLIGVGSDIGGSIRAPAAFSGIYGLKPSVARIPHGGLIAVQNGMEHIVGVIGPMGICLEDLSLFCKVVLDTEPWLYEPSLIELPWKSVQTVPTESRRKLKFGIMYHDGVVVPHPPNSRCLVEISHAIKKAGHSAVTWDPALHSDLVKCISQLLSLDCGQEFIETLMAGGEPPTTLSQALLPDTDKTQLTVQDTWKLNIRRNELQIAYAEQWNAVGVDAIICPVTPSVASAHNESLYWGYTSAFNILDYPCVTVPIGTVADSDTWENFPPQSREPMSELDTTFRNFYTGPEKYKDAPIGLQIITRRLREEQAIMIASEVMGILSKSRLGVSA